MKKTILLLSLFIGFIYYLNSQNKDKKPQLVVGVVIDQMRYDYLIRFSEKYGSNGFKKLLKNGHNLENVHYNYIPTYTAVGHASIYTGTSPENHGIIGNGWYDKYLKESIYCVSDPSFNTVGSSSKNGQKSPYRLQTTTITDQLRLAQNLKGKTISIALKDRSAILPGGHTANAAYWFEGGNEGKFITSTFYMDTLPKWVRNFNKNGKANSYLSQPWNTYYPIETYTESISDNNSYEGTFKGENKPVFPHNLPELRKTNNNYSLLKSVPFGNSIITDFAIAALKGEKLGATKNQTDFLAISYSSTDYVGHKYGVDSKEIEDTYIRMDKEIERLLDFLDNEIGKKNYTLFLTADHAVAQTPNYLNSLNIPGGYFDMKEFTKFTKNLVREKYNSEQLIEKVSNYQIFLNKTELKKLNLKSKDVENFLVEELILFDNVYKVTTAHILQSTQFKTGLLSLVQQGYNQKLSGDVIIIPKPSVIGSGNKKTGTTHGSGYSYDTHVPLVFYGNGIHKGVSKQYYPIIDIAPTIANLLQVEFPNGTTGKIIQGVLK